MSAISPLLLIAVALASVCATNTAPEATSPDTGGVVHGEAFSVSEAVPITRNGCYTLIELTPELA
jgi:hypothetical protein